jgi:hypothetical protein
MRLGYLLWLIAVIIAVIIGLDRFAHISVPYATAYLTADAVLWLFIALALSIIAKVVP